MQKLLTPPVQLPEGGGKVLFDSTPGGPLPHRLEALLGEGFASQLLFDGQEQEKVPKSQAR
jgi:hypothetical protein